MLNVFFLNIFKWLNDYALMWSGNSFFKRDLVDTVDLFVLYDSSVKCKSKTMLKPWCPTQDESVAAGTSEQTT